VKANANAYGYLVAAKRMLADAVWVMDTAALTLFSIRQPTTGNEAAEPVQPAHTAAANTPTAV
jgi:hypothetical protein